MRLAYLFFKIFFCYAVFKEFRIFRSLDRFYIILYHKFRKGLFDLIKINDTVRIYKHSGSIISESQIYFREDVKMPVLFRRHDQTDYNHLHTPANENREDDEELISSVNEKIGYETLCSEYDGNIVTELRNIIADVIKGIRPVKVSGTLIDGKRASELFAGLRHRNVVTVLDSMKRTEVHAPSNWIPAALYNSLFTAAPVPQESAPSFDLDLIMEHAKNTPLRLRCCT